MAAKKISSTEFHAHTDLPDWRVIVRRIEAGFRAPTFDRASVFIGQVASAAEATGHHPDIDLRYPGHVHVSLTTHATNRLTDADVGLARSISARASA
ncbi:MAG: 4a-hydroxytetrahydrobiopterin dehydratase [Ilumatobacteraceae bacterium]